MRTTFLSLILLGLASSVLSQSCVDNCRIADLTNSVCFLCNDGYQLANGQCNDCLPGYSKVGSDCVVQTIPGGGIQPPTTDPQNSQNTNPCLISIRDDCVMCEPSYNLIFGSCVAPPPPPPPPLTEPETDPPTDPSTEPSPPTAQNNPDSGDGNGAAHSNSDCIVVTPGLPC